MLTQEEIKTRFEKVFPKKQAVVLTDVFADYQDDLVKSGDFNELKGIVKELAEAQKRTEEEIRKLTKAQLETDKKVDKIQKNLGGLSHTVGYHLEDRTYKTLPFLLKRDLGVEVEGRLIRRFFEYGRDKEDEVNIYGRGFKDGKEVTIIGESKSQLSKDDIDNFINVVRRVRDYTKRKDIEDILIAVSYAIRPDVEEYARKKGIKVYWSYEFDL